MMGASARQHVEKAGEVTQGVGAAAGGQCCRSPPPRRRWTSPAPRPRGHRESRAVTGSTPLTLTTAVVIPCTASTRTAPGDQRKRSHREERLWARPLRDAGDRRR